MCPRLSAFEMTTVVTWRCKATLCLYSGDESEEKRCGRLGFADLSPCEIGRQQFESHLRGHWNRWMALLINARFDARLSETRWDGDPSYPHSTGCYGTGSNFFPSTSST